MAKSRAKIRRLVRKELAPFLEAPGKDRKSIRDRVLANIARMIEQKDWAGNPTPDAQRWWRWVLDKTDPKPGPEGAGAAGHTFNGPVQVVLQYEGSNPTPRAEDLPPIPSLGTGPHLQERTANERGPVRKTVRKDHTRGA